MSGLKRLGGSRRPQSGGDGEGSVSFDERKEEAAEEVEEGEDPGPEEDDADDVDLTEWDVSRAGKRPNDGR